MPRTIRCGKPTSKHWRRSGACRRMPISGEFRIHATLRQMGIHLSPSTCGRIMARNRQLGLPRPAEPLPHVPKPMPFAATYRHEYWSVDVRYIEQHQLADPNPVYVISILENYSRALLASVISPRQDLTAFLMVLRVALYEHGCPTGIVCDGGGIFKANQVLKIYKELGIERHRIEPGQPWQNYIETHFNIMRRMADYHYAQAETWSELRAAHDRFFADYNLQSHSAHQKRKDGRRSSERSARLDPWRLVRRCRTGSALPAAVRAGVRSRWLSALQAVAHLRRARLGGATRGGLALRRSADGGVRRGAAGTISGAVCQGIADGSRRWPRSTSFRHAIRRRNRISGRSTIWNGTRSCRYRRIEHVGSTSGIEAQARLFP